MSILDEFEDKVPDYAPFHRKAVGGRQPFPRRTHEKSKTKAYRAWGQALERCNNPDSPRYKDWGGRGIRVFFKSFEEFYAEIGDPPTPQHSVDRIDNDGHYAPGNVRWATAKEQRANQRRTRLKQAAA